MEKYKTAFPCLKWSVIDNDKKYYKSYNIISNEANQTYILFVLLKLQKLGTRIIKKRLLKTMVDFFNENELGTILGNIG